MAAETALSLVLLVAAGLTFRSFVEQRFTDPGFDADRVLSIGISLPEARYPTAVEKQAFFDTLVAEVARIPGVERSSLGYGAMPPTDLATGGELLIDGRDSSASQEVWVSMSAVQESFLNLMGIPLLAGRDLVESDVANAETAAETPIVVNSSMARRYWPEGDALGARFRFNIDPPW